MKSKLLLALVPVVALGGIAAPSTAQTTRAATTVTIQVEGTDFSGAVKSTRPRKCAAGRKVVLRRQVGDVQKPSTDPVIGSDTASWNGERFEWSTGNTGQSGRFYARAGRTPLCKGDSSRTLQTE